MATEFFFSRSLLAPFFFFSRAPEHNTTMMDFYGIEQMMEPDKPELGPPVQGPGSGSNARRPEDEARRGGEEGEGGDESDEESNDDEDDDADDDQAEVEADDEQNVDPLEDLNTPEGAAGFGRSVMERAESVDIEFISSVKPLSQLNDMGLVGKLAGSARVVLTDGVTRCLLDFVDAVELDRASPLRSVYLEEGILGAGFASTAGWVLRQDTSDTMTVPVFRGAGPRDPPRTRQDQLTRLVSRLLEKRAVAKTGNRVKMRYGN
ncbi:MAG: hypothetical protein AAFS07_18925 [Pseudomonadota bacterium]